MLDVLWVVLGLAASALVGWPITAGILSLGARSAGSRRLDDEGFGDAGFGDAGSDGGDLDGVDPAGAAFEGDFDDESVLRGGLWIGVLERLAVSAAIMAGYPTAIAFIVAVKGLGRYPELRQTPAAAERFIIGSLASMLWAAAIGILVRVLLG